MASMKRAMEIMPAPAGYEPFDLEVVEPGILRTVLTGYEQPNLVIPTSMGKPAPAEMKPIPALAFEITPGRERRKRSFVWLPAGVALAYPGELAYRHCYVDEATGTPVFLYEATNPKKGDR